MKTNSIKLLGGLATAALLIQARSASAQDFQPIDLTPYGNFDLNSSGSGATGFPLASPTYLGHVPFIQDGGANEVWNGYYAFGDDNATLTVPLNIPDAYGFYTLINTWWGQDFSQGSFASVSFGFSDNNTLTFDLYGNQDIRDYNNPGSGYTTTINGTTTQVVYINSAGGYLLDRQWFDFGAEAGQTLTSFTVVDTGGSGTQDVLLSGATAQTGMGGQVSGPALLPGETGSPVPEPSTLALAGIGGISALAMFRRRK